MITHDSISDQQLMRYIRHQKIKYGGNKRLRIYGFLRCASGKRMKRENRVFFKSESEALINGFRPCGHCMQRRYKNASMDLFNDVVDGTFNYLPKDGIVNYYGKILSAVDADRYLDVLLKSIEWKNDEAVIFGKHIITKRKVAWYGDSNFNYTYSKTTKQALLWTKELQELKNLIENKTGDTFNSCLLNLYHTGEEGMAWHSDAEKELKKNGAIASMSFGAERKFSFKHKISGEIVSLRLEHGSLLIMKDTTQSHWLHRLPPTTIIKTPRVNLTFRTINL